MRSRSPTPGEAVFIIGLSDAVTHSAASVG